MNLLAAWFELAGPERSVQIFSTKLVGINAANGWKLLLTAGFVAAVLVVSFIFRQIARLFLRSWKEKRVDFWIEQVIKLLAALLIVIGVVSFWFSDNTGKLATFAGLFSAGLAFALQQVITAFAGYFVILRGKTFNVGDRITMGGVRGDVIALGFIRTTIMEMGQAPGEQEDDPSIWVQARQYTGRIVTVTNDKVFDTPIYNYTREFPYLWEEMRIPISYKDDRATAEKILLEAARDLTVKIADVAEEDKKEMERRYVMKISEMEPRVYWRLTDNWVEMSIRFLVRERGIRQIKDAMARQIIGELDKARIGIASGTYEIVGLPPVHVVTSRDASETK